MHLNRRVSGGEGERPATKSVAAKQDKARVDHPGPRKIGCIDGILIPTVSKPRGADAGRQPLATKFLSFPLGPGTFG
jgi:hypothetical protein